MQAMEESRSNLVSKVFMKVDKIYEAFAKDILSANETQLTSSKKIDFKIDLPKFVDFV
jgi:hypothetical protein